jgi:hypothetical protein
VTWARTKADISRKEPVSTFVRSAEGEIERHNKNKKVK